MLQRVAACCSVLPRVAACCSVNVEFRSFSYAHDVVGTMMLCVLCGGRVLQGVAGCCSANLELQSCGYAQASVVQCFKLEMHKCICVFLVLACVVCEYTCALMCAGMYVCRGVCMYMLSIYI